MAIEITVLLENSKPDQSDFEVEHGLSLFVKTSKSTFIFDCGHTKLFRFNAALMDINLLEVQFAVLSHSHYDHAGGFPALVQRTLVDYLCTGSNFWREKFSYNADTHKYKYAGCGFTEADLNNWGIEQVICEDIIELDDEAWLISNFIKKYKFETISVKFVCGDDKKPDDFSDEVVLALREGDGVAVVTGCAHNGILNIVTTVQQRLNLPVHSIIGGIHLKGASSERIKKTMIELKKLGVRQLALCHCSGEEVYKYLESNDLEGLRILTGSTIKIE